LGRGLHLLQDLGRFVYVAFVVDVFAQRIVGWHAATTKVTDVVLTSLRIELWDRDRQRDPGRAGSAAAPLQCRVGGWIQHVVATP
jgi:transposase InsO family protein